MVEVAKGALSLDEASAEAEVDPSVYPRHLAIVKNKAPSDVAVLPLEGRVLMPCSKKRIR